MDKEQEKLVNDNYKLAGFVAKQFINNRYIREYDDLLSIANIGLVKAAITYKDTKNVKFTTYAVSCCKNEIASNLKKNGALKRSVEKLCYLHEKIGTSDTGSVELIEYIEYKEPDSEVYSKELDFYLSKLRDSVTPYEYDLFMEYTGVISGKGKTRKELANIYNVSCGTISYYVDKCRKVIRDYRSNEGMITC